MLTACIYIVYICIAATVLYTLYKIIWYTIVCLRLQGKLRRLSRNGCHVKLTGSVFSIALGKKGHTHAIIEKDGKRYAIGILSFISSHSRWHIERGKNHDYVEARRWNNFFYKNEVNSGTEPEHAREWRRETRFQRCILAWEREKMSNTEYVLLVHPTPVALTYATTTLEYLRSGDELWGYRILYAKGFFDFFENQSKS